MLEAISRESKNILTTSLFEPVTAAQVEWALRWMEDSSEDDLGFGAALLANAAARGGSAPVIRDLHWHLPVPRVDRSDDPGWQAPWTVLQTWTFPQYAAILEPRLRRILLRERTEPIAPYILVAWGLEAGDWNEVDQLRCIGERYRSHVAALRRRAGPPAKNEAQAWARTQVARAVAGDQPLDGLTRLIAQIVRSASDSRWIPVDLDPPKSNAEATVMRGRVDAIRRMLRAQFGPNLSAVMSDLALLQSRWAELGLTSGF